MTVISFQYNFIFIKTAKTAGTSIEIDLSDVVEESAIVTPIIPVVEGHRPRNYRRFWRDGYWNHMPATRIRDFLGARRFYRMHRLCVEREPVSKCISHFHMLLNSPDHAKPDGPRSWEEYCERGRFPIDIDSYSERAGTGRRLLVDKVIRYENLAAELAETLGRLGVPGFALRARAKAEYSRNTIVEQADVTTAQRARIYERFSECLALTGLYPRCP